MDADLQAIYNLANSASPKQLNVMLDCTKEQDFRNGQAVYVPNSTSETNSYSKVTGSVQQQQDLYQWLFNTILGARMKWVPEGSAYGSYLLNQACTDAHTAAVKMFPVMKANLDLINQGNPPQ